MAPQPTTVAQEEIQFHPLSFGDPTGRVFWWQQGLYRGINPHWAPLFRRLFETGLANRLQTNGLLVPTEVASLQVDGFDLVLKHRPVRFVSYAYEWCPQMLKEAAMLQLELECELASRGLTLKDAHPWNVLFEGSQPQFLDLGSITPIMGDGLWQSYDEFCRFYVFPLLMMKAGKGRIARWLLHDYDQGVQEADAAALAPKEHAAFRAAVTARRWFWEPEPELSEEGGFWADAQRQVLAPEYRPVRPKALRKAIDRRHRLRRFVASLDLAPPDTMWANYYENEFPSFTPSPDWHPKHHSVYEVLQTTRPASVVDVGSNRGWYAQLAARLGSDVVAFDVDEPSVTQLFLDVRRGQERILPLIMDFRNPSPGYGLCNQWLGPATERLSCDLVMALALVHHLVFKMQLRFEQIVAGLSQFAKRWLLIEFIPREDKYVREWVTPAHDWYTQENFERALRQVYRQVRLYPSHIEPRIMFLCER